MSVERSPQFATPEQIRERLVSLRESNPHAFNFGMTTVAYMNGVSGVSNLNELPDSDHIVAEYVIPGSLAHLVGASAAHVAAWEDVGERDAYREIVSLGSALYPDTRAPLKLQEAIY